MDAVQLRVATLALARFESGRGFDQRLGVMMRHINEWQAASTEVWSPVFEGWVRQNDAVTLRPGETEQQVLDELAAEYGTARLRLYYWLDAGW